MKLIIERDILATALSRVSPLIGRSTIPILGYMKLSAATGTLTLSGTNMMAAASQSASAAIDTPGETCVTADKFSALVNSLPRGSQMELELANRKLAIRYGKGRASFPTWDARDFPVMKPPEKSAPIMIEAAELARLLTMTLPFAMSGERPYLCGVYMIGRGRDIQAVATDGNALALGRSAGATEFPGIIIPRDACAALIKTLGGVSGEIEIAVSETMLAIEAGNYSFVTKLVDGTFPKYGRVIPPAVEHPILIESGALKEVAQRVQAVTEADDATRSHPRSVHLKAEGERLHIEGGSDADQKIDEDIEIEAVDMPLEIRLGTEYVLDAIEALGEGLLQLHITDPLAPMLVRRDGNDAECVVIMARRS